MAIFSAISSLTLFFANVVGLSFAAASAAAMITVGAGILGLGAFAVGAFAPQIPQFKTPQAQAIINQSAGPRVRGYGRALLGGTRAFWDSKSGDLYQVIMMHSGQIDAIEHIRVGDIVATIDGSGNVTNSSLQARPSSGIGTQPMIQIQTRTGTSGQTAFTLMTNNWSQWTSEHRLRGIAALAVRFRSPRAEDFQKVYPEGERTPVRALCRLTRVYDPRTDTTAWSDNASLCILDYLTSQDGYRRSIDDIDLPSFAAFADICDQDIPRAGGGTEKRYRLWGVYALTDEPESILAAMRRACDGELYETAEGKIAIRGGVWQAPTVAIGPDDILGHALEQGNNRFAAFNELKILYTSPQHDYQTMEAEPWIDLADQAERGVLESSLDLDYVPSPAQARRLAKIHIAKSNPRWKGRVRCSVAALNALGERTIQLIIPELQINDAFFVSKFDVAADLSAVELEVISISEAAYAWTTAEEGENPPVPQETSPDLTFPVPEDLTLSEPEPERILATVSSPDRDGLTLQVQIRAGAGSLWQEMETQDDNLSAIYEPAPPDYYQARARWLGPSSTAGEWSDIEDIDNTP